MEARTMETKVETIDRIVDLYLAMHREATLVDVRVDAQKVPSGYVAVAQGFNDDGVEVGIELRTDDAGPPARPSEAIAALLRKLEAHLDAQLDRLAALRDGRTEAAR
jgi:hypothetical protein